MVLENKFPENYHDLTSAVTERTTAIENELGKGTYQEIFFEGIHIAYGDMRFRQETELLFESDYETVEMHFDLCGSSQTNITGATGYSYEFATNRHNIIYVPGIKGSIRFGLNSARTLEINLVPSLFKRYLQDTGAYDDFLNLIRNQSPALLGKHNLPITPAMMHIIHAIIGCSKKGLYKRMFLEAKVIELLLLQLEQFATHDCNVFCSLKPADIEKMYHAKEIILRQLHNPCSLIDLARQVGTNEFTLKKGFKEVFGTTVFGMVAEVKMEQARQLLLSGEKNIAEVSELTGYKYQAHFTQAFKKKFGVSPRQYVK
jgi:AraC-like DNA-binding protein